MLRKLVATTAFAAVTAIASQAGAVVIDSASYTLAGCLGAASCTIGVATLTAQPSPVSYTHLTLPTILLV